MKPIVDLNNVDREDPEGLPPSWRRHFAPKGEIHEQSKYRLTAATAAAGVPWNYRRNDAGGPAHWDTAVGGDPKCIQGMRQSPIDIMSLESMMNFVSAPLGASMATYDATLPDLSLNFVTYNNLTMVNNGHTVQVSMAVNDPMVSTFGGGALSPDMYKVAQFHFHQLSEHTVNGKFYPAEMHIVGMNMNPAHAADSLELAVVGIMLQETAGAADHPGLTTVLDAIEAGGLKTIGAQTTVKKLDLASFLTSFKKQPTFWTYLGSLTTPTCREVVTWHVLQAPLPVNGAQLDRLREVLGNEEVGKFINRPVQPLNNRVVRTNKITPVIPSTVLQQSLMATQNTANLIANNGNTGMTNGDKLAIGIGVGAGGGILLLLLLVVFLFLYRRSQKNNNQANSDKMAQMTRP